MVHNEATFDQIPRGEQMSGGDTQDSGHGETQTAQPQEEKLLFQQSHPGCPSLWGRQKGRLGGEPCLLV
jgi:hypothetical protein